MVTNNNDESPVSEESAADGVETELPDADALVGLCLGNEQKMKDWMHAIVNFSHCEIELPKKQDAAVEAEIK